MRRTTVRCLVAMTCAVSLAACGSSTPAHTAVDSTFVLHMWPHHLRALEVGMLAEQRGGDPRVVAFGQRIIREQTPEANELKSWIKTLHAQASASDAATADGYITDAQLATLKTEPVAAFDHDVLLASASSEQGAATMAGVELAGGTYQPARTVARSIAGAPGSEIPELRALAATLGS